MSDLNGLGSTPGNGLGRVAGRMSNIDSGLEWWASRPSDPVHACEWDDPTGDAALANLNGSHPEVGLPEILLAMASLTERQRFVIECRYGLRSGMDGKRLSQREVADLMGVRQQTVNESEQAALKRLRGLLDPVESPIRPQG